MRKFFSFIAAAIFTLFLFSNAAMAQEKIMRDGDRLFILPSSAVQVGEAEEGISLTSSELHAVMGGGQIVTKSTVTETWGRYYLYRVSTTEVKEVVRLDEGVVKRVKVEKKGVVEHPTPFLPLAILYLILLPLSIPLVRRSSDSAAGIAAAFATIAATLAVMTLVATTAATFAAIAATTFNIFAAIAAFTAAATEPRNPVGVKVANWATGIGVVAMALAVVTALTN